MLYSDTGTSLDLVCMPSRKAHSDPKVASFHTQIDEYFAHLFLTTKNKIKCVRL